MKLSFALFLFTASTLIFRNGDADIAYWLSSALAAGGIGLLFTETETWIARLLVAGLAGLTISMVQGIFDDTLPQSIVLYGTGSASLSYLTTDRFLTWLQKTHLISPLIQSILLGLLGGLWTYNDVLKSSGPTPELLDIIPLLILGLMGSIALIYLGTPTPRFPVAIALILIALVIQIANGGLSLSGLALGLMLIAVLGGMLWYVYHNGHHFKSTDSPVQTAQRGTLWAAALIFGHLAGWFLQSISVVGVVLVGAFGLLWLPLLSTFVGFRAFMTLADEEII